MGCRTYRRLLMSRDDELTPEERRRLGAHLAVCASCTREAAGIAGMQQHLGRVRGLRYDAADPARRAGRIIDAVKHEESTEHAVRPLSILERSLGVVELPVVRYAAAVLLIVIVGSGVWQGMDVMSEVQDLASDRAMLPSEPGPDVLYAVTIRDHEQALATPALSGAKVRIVDGSVLLTAEEVAFLRELEDAPPKVLAQLGITEELMARARSWKDDPAIRVRPIVSYKNGKGV